MKDNYEDDVTLYHGDCLEVMRTLPDASVDSVVTDPPYGLGFMGREWDELPPGEPWARECLRVLKPGGHMLAFGGTRSWHRLACAVEDAGFEVRDSIAWLYGSGFPKSLDVSKAIDKAAGAERARRERPAFGGSFSDDGGTTYGTVIDGTPITPDAEQWQGWGTALKPAFEPIVVARKPLAGTVAANILEHGTGALNIDGCRIGMSGADLSRLTDWHAKYGGTKYADGDTYAKGMGDIQPPNPAGRWPTNVVLDESQAEVLDEQSGESKSRFFPTFRYQAKAPRSERPRYKRDGGSDNATTYGQMKTRECNVCRSRAKAAGGDQSGKPWPTCGHEDWSWVEQQSARDEFVAHPTVKPLTLMSWLVRLVTPPGGTVLEPFAGSGTTVEAAVLEGFHCIAIEREADYLPLIMSRIHRRRDPVVPPTDGMRWVASDE